MNVRVRIAPSPTGYAHLGLVYQAIFDWVCAKKYNGKFVLRIEDTDRSRFVEGAEDVIYNSLKWTNLMPDEGPREGGEYGPYRSSERLEIYKKYANQLIEKGFAYRCFCTKERLDEMRKAQEDNHQPPMYDKTCRNLSTEEVNERLETETPYVIRMKIPENQKITIRDEIVGNVEFDSSQIDDQVIIKSDGFATYHLAALVDDYLMKITHVFRGTEWLPSAPKHFLLWEYLGWKDNRPKYIHLPLLLNSEGQGKLSKRNAHASVEFYQKEGFLPEAVVNYLANIVWNHPEGREIFPIEEFGKALDLENNKFDIKPNGVKFDLQKLEWMNGEYIRSLPDDELTKRLQDFLVDHPSYEKISPVVPLIKERIKKLSDFIPLTYFLFENPEYDKEIFNKIKIENKKEFLEKVIEKLKSFSVPWDPKVFENTFRQIAEQQNIKVGDMFQFLRVCFSGQLVTPPLFESIKIVGEDEVIKRFDNLQKSNILS